ncbi:MAG: HAMP domain-containing protein [Desulfobacterales bacterium]|nr:HAMP domain-containing protein [Desulfobacterales bacterium]
MFLKKLLEQRHTLSFRLTLWYGGIFIISSFAVFLIFYLSVASVIYGRIDDELSEDMEEFASYLASKGFEEFIREVRDEIDSEDPEKVFFRAMRSDGSEIISSDMSLWGNPGIGKKTLKHMSSGETAFETIFIPLKSYNTRIVHKKIGQDIIMQTGILLEKETRLMSVFKKVFGISMITTLFIAALAGWFMAKQALSGVEQVTQTAQKISEGAIDQRVSVKSGGNEIEQLANTFNHMLDRIQKLITEMREMTDNIAHDLKSPLTRIRGAAEVILTSNNSQNEYEHMAASIIEECDNLVEMINTMLDISELETGVRKIEFRKIKITDIVQDICELFEPLAEKKNQLLLCNASEQLMIFGHVKMIQQMVSNLLDNAVKYTPDSGVITVSLHKNGKNKVVLSISDTGPGIFEEDLPHIFERFYRADRSRSKAGSGLGLSMVKLITTVHSGDIIVQNLSDSGSKFTVMLPDLSFSS